jgi:RND family efflux transporter MFP subunit
LLSSRSVSKQHYEQVRTEAAVARARVTQMEARTARATRDLERTLVRAPYAGSIVARLAHEGAMAGSGPILVLQESGALEAVVNVPEATPVPVRAGDPVELFIEALDHALLTRVDRVSDRIDPATRTYEVRCPVPDPTRTVKAGAYARAVLSPARPQERPVVRRSALLTRDGRSFVLRVDQGVITPVLVRVGVLGEQQAEILDGIAAGDVVVHGEAVARLGAGQHVEPVFDSGPEPADAADDSPAMPAS